MVVGPECLSTIASIDEPIDESVALESPPLLDQSMLPVTSLCVASETCFWLDWRIWNLDSILTSLVVC